MYNVATHQLSLQYQPDTYHSLNYFGHVIYVPQIDMYQYIARLLTHPSKYLV